MKKEKRSSIQKCKERWLRWLTASEEMSQEDAQLTIKCLTGLLEHLKDGRANIVFRMKAGKVVLVRANLFNYERWFHHPLQWESLGYTIPYWDEEKDAWRVFSVANLIDWRPIYY